MIDVLARATASDPDALQAIEARVRAAQAGDVAAFEAIYRENVGRVLALCLRLTANGAEAEHLTQDTFVRAWERLATFRGESAFATWLRHVAVSVVLGARRENARRTKRVVTTDDEVILASACDQRRDDDGLDLERAIATLPEGARTVFVLHDIEGYKHDEIAALAGIAEGTSKAQLHRARTLLKEVLR
jgi:RNA polymerase sigma-70 factor, ECF subfamily